MTIKTARTGYLFFVILGWIILAQSSAPQASQCFIAAGSNTFDAHAQSVKLCACGSVTLIAVVPESSSLIPPFTYAWRKSCISQEVISTQQAYTVMGQVDPVEGDTYSMTITDSKGTQCSSTILILDAGTDQVFTVAQSPTVPCPDGTVILTASTCNMRDPIFTWTTNNALRADLINMITAEPPLKPGALS